jgi:hypothetical protein
MNGTDKGTSNSYKGELPEITAVDNNAPSLTAT